MERQRGPRAVRASRGIRSVPAPATQDGDAFHRAFPPVPRSFRESYSALREEYLRLKALSYNEHTSLPAPMAILPEIRAGLSASPSLAILMVGVSNLQEIEESLGWQAADGLLIRVTEIVRDFTAAHLSSGTLLAQEGTFGEQVLVFIQRSAAAAEPVLDEIERLDAALAGAVAAGLAAWSLPGGMRPRLASGHAIVADNPFLRFERVVNRAIVAAKSMMRDQAERARLQRRMELQDIIQAGRIGVVFQPIIDLGACRLIGHEALCRGPRNTAFEVADAMFALSHELDLARELDDRCLEIVLSLPQARPAAVKLFLNILPESVGIAHLEPERFLGLLATAGILPQDVVLEISERSRVADYSDLRRRLAPLRDAGLGSALDDVGAGYSGLRAVPELEPDFLKVDISLVRDIHREPAKQRVLDTIVDLAGRIGARVICEGIENEEELQAVIDHGVELGQGFFLMRPSPEPAASFDRRR